MRASVEEFIETQVEESLDFWKSLGITPRSIPSSFLPPPTVLRRPRLMIIPVEIANGPIEFLVGIAKSKGVKVREANTMNDTLPWSWQRHPSNGTYGVWHADRWQTDPDLLGKSGVEVIELGIVSTTIIEELVLNLSCIMSGHEPARSRNICICSGSMTNGEQSKIVRVPVVNVFLEEIYMNLFDATNPRPDYGARRVHAATG